MMNMEVVTMNMTMEMKITNVRINLMMHMETMTNIKMETKLTLN